MPLWLVTRGLSGAWIGNRTAVATYRPPTSTIANVFIGLGFLQVPFRTKAHCADGVCFTRPLYSFITEMVFRAATALALLSLTLGWWE